MEEEGAEGEGTFKEFYLPKVDEAAAIASANAALDMRANGVGVSVNTSGGVVEGATLESDVVLEEVRDIS